MVKKKDTWFQVGRWSFVGGLVLGFIAGLFSYINTWTTITIFILGIITGLLNIYAKEELNFLISSVAFLLASLALANLTGIIGALLGTAATKIISVLLIYFIVYTAGSIFVMAIKLLYSKERD